MTLIYGILLGGAFSGIILIVFVKVTNAVGREVFLGRGSDGSPWWL